MKKITILFLFCLLSACSSGKSSFEEHNDFFTFLNEDRDFTQGFRVKNETQNRSWALGQDIYTPANKRQNPPDPDGRPYAGHIFGEYRVLLPLKEGSRYFYGAEIGIVGPAALGKQTQCEIHALLGQYCPAGWPEQLKNEPGITLRAGVETRNTDLLAFLLGEDIQKITVEVGNFSTALKFESVTRWQVGNVFYFAGPSLQLVARDIFLDGNSFRDSASVEKEFFWAEMMGGVGYDFKIVTVSWFIAARSPRFKSQRESYNYGGIKFEWGDN